MPKQKIAFLTAGGLAPCLSAAMGALIEAWGVRAPDADMIGYRSGYAGLLLGKSIVIDAVMRAKASLLYGQGGSPIGNSRVKLTNVADCIKRGLVKEGEIPLRIAADQLVRDGVTILHTIGGDDTNMTAADLAAYLAQNGYHLTVVGLPKTVDNDVSPIRLTMGATTAAQQGAMFFGNVANEMSAAPGTFIVHEIMGRHCGWLTAATARAWRTQLAEKKFIPGLGPSRQSLDMNGVYIPEATLNLEEETDRLSRLMAEGKGVSVFLSEGAFIDDVVREREARGETLPRDAFGHISLDSVNVGDWFGQSMAKRIGAKRCLVQKSGYFARSAAAGAEDLALIKALSACAVEAGLEGISGVVGHDTEQGDAIRTIEFPRIRGGKSFDPATPWFQDVLADIGQAPGL